MDECPISQATIALGVLCAGLSILITSIVMWTRRFPRLTLVMRPAPYGELEVDRSAISLSRCLGSGSTSRVTLGRMPNGTEVAVKCLGQTCSYEQAQGFFLEMNFLRQLRHANVVRIVGAATLDDPVLLVTEYCEIGALDEYLQSNIDGLQVSRLNLWATQMGSALTHVHTQNIIHRDVAARNFLLDASSIIKLCDFGMARALSDSGVYQHTGSIHVATRWAAPECLKRGRFSRGTDVWAFCVTLFELYSWASVPYGRVVREAQVYHMILQGQRLSPPPLVPSPVANVMNTVFSASSMTGVSMSIWEDCTSRLQIHSG